MELTTIEKLAITRINSVIDANEEQLATLRWVESSLRNTPLYNGVVSPANKLDSINDELRLAITNIEEYGID